MNVARFYEEYNNIYKCIAKDEELRKMLDIKSDNDVPKKILRERYNPNVITGELMTRVYQVTSRETRNDRSFWDNFEVKVTGSIKYRQQIIQIVDRVINLLNNKEVNNRYIKFVTITGDEFAPQELYETGARFKFINYI